MRTTFGSKSVFYLWTTSSLLGHLQGYMLRTSNQNLNLKIRDLDELFRNASGVSTDQELSREEMRELELLFIKESNGPAANRAVAADMIKFLVSLKYGGLYVDAGLEILPKERSENSFPRDCTPLNEKFNQYDYMLSGHKNYPDLQIMWFSQLANVKILLVGILRHLIEQFPNPKKGQDSYNIHRQQRIALSRVFPADTEQGFECRARSYTGDALFYIFQKVKSEGHRIGYFSVDRPLCTQARFDDFPEIGRKDQDIQPYENYRKSEYLPQDDTGAPSNRFPRK